MAVRHGCVSVRFVGLLMDVVLAVPGPGHVAMQPLRNVAEKFRSQATVVIKLGEDSKGRTRAEHELVWKPVSKDDVYENPNGELKLHKLPEDLYFVFYGEVCAWDCLVIKPLPY